MPKEMDIVQNGLSEAWKSHRSAPFPSLKFRAGEADDDTVFRPAADLPDGSKLGGIEFGRGTHIAAFLWMKAEGKVSLRDVLFQGTIGAEAIPVTMLELIGLRAPEMIISSYNFAKLPGISREAMASAKVPATIQRLLPADSRLWGGTYFEGVLSLDFGLAGPASEPLKKLFPGDIQCAGSLRQNGPFRLLAIKCQTPGESLSLRPGAEWDCSLKEVEIASVLLEERNDIDSVLAKGTLKLAGHETPVELQVNLATGTVALEAEPNWTIDLAWLKKLIGGEEFAKGAGSVLEESSGTGERLGFAGAQFRVAAVAGSLAWKPDLAVRSLFVTLGNPEINGKVQAWKLLGGEILASVTAHWDNPGKGPAEFNCLIEGLWTWDGLSFGAALDTRSGEFYAELDFERRKDEFKAFATERLFPNVELVQELKKPEASDPQASIKAALAKPFQVAHFEVTGNYRHKRIEARLRTSGYLGFRLRGKDDSDLNRLDVRIGDLVCAGSYDQSGSEADWSLEVGGTFALLAGGEPKGLGAGARMTGKFSRTGGRKSTEIELKIKSFHVGQLLGMVLADEPPKAFRDVEFKEVELLYQASEKFSLKSKSNLELIEKKVFLKELALDLVSKPKDESSGGQDAGTKDSGSVKIGFGEKLVVELKAEFEKKQIKFSGSAKDIDVSELITSFFETKSGASSSGAQPKPESREKNPNHIIAREIKIDLTIARSSKDDKGKGATSGDSGDDKLKESGALTVSVKLARGESELTLLLVAAAMSENGGTAEWKVLFAGDLDLKARGLPLVGSILGDKADSFGVELHTLYVRTKASTTNNAAGGADKKVVEKLFGHAKDVHGVWKEKKDGKEVPIELTEGFGVKAGIRTLPLLPSGKGEQSKAPTTTSERSEGSVAKPVEPPPPGKGLTWQDTDLRIGPIHLSRIGYGTVEPLPEATDPQTTGVVSLDAALDLGVVRMAVIGLRMEVQFPSFTVIPRLEGLALNVRNGPVEITGALVYRDNAFAGLAQIKTANMTLGATGRFSLQGSRPSFFIYCVYASALGGPPAFFIEGLAGGMGYDTRLVMPEVEEVPKFALVKAAKEGLGGTPEQQIAAFDACVVAAPNNLWFAAGVRFSSFKILDSVVVVAISIGEDVEVDLFGVMSLRMPPPFLTKKSQPEGGNPPAKSPLTIASADLAIRGKIAPKKGEIWVRGQIMPGAFLFDEKCQLKGGFAFQMWFGGPHKGDFVATIGGYHPLFKKPDHYFSVPRFGIEWQLTDDISIKGEAYMAITSRAIMAGGRLEMLYQSGSVRASFVAEAHFLTAWAPLRYMADVRISVDASFTLKVWRWNKEFNIHASAQLHLEGPPFTGYAKIELGPIDIKITFGSAKPPEALTWPELAGRFLPAPESIISLRGTGIDKPNDKLTSREAERRESHAKRNPKKVTTYWTLLPGASWELAIETVIPVTKIEAPGKSLPLEFDGIGFFAVPTRKRITRSVLEVAGNFGDLGLVIETENVTRAPVAPALWDTELPGANASEQQLNPSPSKSWPTGIVLKHIVPKFDDFPGASKVSSDAATEAADPRPDFGPSIVRFWQQEDFYRQPEPGTPFALGKLHGDPFEDEPTYVRTMPPTALSQS